MAESQKYRNKGSFVAFIAVFWYRGIDKGAAYLAFSNVKINSVPTPSVLITSIF